MNALLRRRRMMQAQASSDNKIWLIKDGVDITDVTGGYECSTVRVDARSMGGWSYALPVLTQGDGYLRATINGNPVSGSLIPNSYLTYSEVSGKSVYLDFALSLSNKSYFSVVLRSSGGVSYLNSPNIFKSASSNRATESFVISASGVSEAGFPIQISTRNTSYVDIYNMWIE